MTTINHPSFRAESLSAVSRITIIGRQEVRGDWFGADLNVRVIASHAAGEGGRTDGMAMTVIECADSVATQAVEEWCDEDADVFSYVREDGPGLPRDPAALIATLRDAQESARLSWDTAVDTAGPEYAGGSVKRAREMRSLADAGEAAYDEAVSCIEERQDGWQVEAERYLQEARSAESEGGDCSDADRALAALAAYASR